VQIVFGVSYINLGRLVLLDVARVSIIHHRPVREHLYFLQNRRCLKKVKVNYYS
jgi:hypothetical protein